MRKTASRMVGSARVRAELAILRVFGGHADADDADRGDVPGWVLVTLMTAGLVILIWGLAGPALAKLFNDAIARVAGGL